ncbi:hypothetical protein J2S45_000276 [Trueperella abortisuis]|uniref:Uncharacterized protein n=1 Tax=Trueperella abortisuis TaxID=445930 RepID=A0ABT9PFW8_9ACTO|nr:hypothetical protein [Trueperella abortisuis]
MHHLSLSAQACQTHQPGSLFATNINTFTSKRVPHFPHTVDAVIASVNLAKTFYEGRIAKAASAHATCFVLALPARGDKSSLTIIP